MTITSEVGYAKATSNPRTAAVAGAVFTRHKRDDGRVWHGREASAHSVAKLRYDQVLDGISLTSNLVATALGKTPAEQVENLTRILDGFFGSAGYHVNPHVLNREPLVDAGEQRLDVIPRTLHGAL